MAEPQYGPPCPGCTPEKITAQIARMPDAYPLCIACRDHGALFHHAQNNKKRVQEDAQKRARGQIGQQNRKAHAQS